MRFLHCADLHIGRGQNAYEQRYEDFIEAFSQISKAAIENHADFIVASGDVFDTKSIQSATLWRVTKILSMIKEKGIKFFAIEGNHDKAFYFEKESWLYYLNNIGLLILLKPEIQDGFLKFTRYDGQNGAIFEDKDYRIVGLGYFGALTKKRLEESCAALKRSEKYTVVMLHAALQYQMSEDMAGVDPDAMLSLREFSDYLALGHIHKTYQAEEFLYNPGSLEYVDLNEARRKDKKGFFLVDVDENTKSFVPVKTRQHIFIDADMTGVHTKEEAWTRVFDSIKKTDSFENPVIQIDLKGETLLETYLLDTAQLEEEIMRRYHAIEVNVSTYLLNTGMAQEDETGPAIDRRQMEKRVMLQIMKETGYDDPFAQSLADFAISIKDAVNSRFDGEEIANMAEQLAFIKAGDGYGH